jgi:hypothetical protein
MANGKGEGIGSIFRLWQHGKFEQKLNHPLHLSFASAAVSYNGKLCFFGSVFDNRNAAPSCCKDHYAARHAEFDGALHIFVDELRFHGNSMRGMKIKECLYTIKEEKIPRWQLQIWRGADAPKVDWL